MRRRQIAFGLVVALGAMLAGAPAGARAQRQSDANKKCCHTARTAKKPGHAKAKSETERFGERVEAILGSGETAKGEWGLLVEDAETGNTLFERNADKYFVPASNMKLFTTALALAKLGPDFRFHTTVETSGVVAADGVLKGDLSLVGRGDPNLSNRKFPYQLKEEFDGPPEKALAELADGVAKKGVKEITGDVIGDDSYFPRERYPNGWEIDDMVWEYGAAVSAIVVDDNTTTITLTPPPVAGEPVQALVDPDTPDFAVENRVSTSAPDGKSDLRLTREPGSGRIVVQGTMPAGSAPRKLVMAIQEPALHAAAMLKALLEARGIKVDGLARAQHEALTLKEQPTVLAEHVSVPLGDAVKLINKISQNLHAEMLLRTTARQEGIWEKPEDLAKFPQTFYAEAGIAPKDVIQTDGSGLSRHDLVTPRALAALLTYAQKQTWFDPYYASLPVAGMDGTLEDRMRNTVAAGRVHAKTGSVEHVRTLSGFAETPGGRRLIFSFLSNNMGGENHEAADALRDLCVAMLEEFNETPKKAKEEHRHPQ